MPNTEETNILEESLEDSQILDETVTNERIVEHPKLGKVRLMTPTLELQRKIDAATRAKKKELRTAVDEREDPDDPSKVIREPAYKSKELLKRQYAEIGWWTEDDEKKLQELSKEHFNLLTELELLGFESEENINDRIVDARQDLLKSFEDMEDGEEKTALITAVFKVTSPDTMCDPDSDRLIRENASSSDIDDILDSLTILDRLLKTYVKMVEVYTDLLGMQSEANSLFQDSWQEQLQYYIRLAQVYYCTQNVETGKPLWPSLRSIEREKDTALIRWVFTELNAMWQGMTDEAREKMQKYSFMDRLIANKESSEDSPDQPNSSGDGDSPVSEQTSSIEATESPEPSTTDS